MSFELMSLGQMADKVLSDAEMVQGMPGEAELPQ